MDKTHKKLKVHGSQVSLFRRVIGAVDYSLALASFCLGSGLPLTLVACSKDPVSLNSTSSIAFSPLSGGPGTLLNVTGIGVDLGGISKVSIAGVDGVIVSRRNTDLKVMVLGSASGPVVATGTDGIPVASKSDFSNINPSPISSQQGGKLFGSGGIFPEGQQGSSVAISADGDTIAIGGATDDLNTGAVWVFVRVNGAWTQQGWKLVGTGAIGQAHQGISVAISADGNTIVAGGPIDDSLAGAVWVFVRENGNWTQQGAKLTGSGAVGNSYFGGSVALSADGNTLIVGGRLDNSVGAAWVFVRSNGMWTQQGGKFTGSDLNGNSSFGASVSISADGNSALIGGPSDNSSNGSIWIFTRVGSSWVQQGAKIVGSGSTASAYFGTSVSLSADGNVAVIGGAGDNSNTGAVWCFVRSGGGGWVQQGSKVVGTGQVYFGSSVSVNADGLAVVVGIPSFNASAGATAVLNRVGGSLIQQGNKLVGTGAVGSTSGQGRVALSADGKTAVIGAPGDDNNRGAFWVFVP